MKIIYASPLFYFLVVERERLVLRFCGVLVRVVFCNSAIFSNAAMRYNKPSLVFG